MKMLPHWNIFGETCIYVPRPRSHLFGSRINHVFYSFDMRAVSFNNMRIYKILKQLKKKQLRGGRYYFGSQFRRVEYPVGKEE